MQGFTGSHSELEHWELGGFEESWDFGWIMWFLAFLKSPGSDRSLDSESSTRLFELCGSIAVNVVQPG